MSRLVIYILTLTLFTACNNSSTKKNTNAEVVNKEVNSKPVAKPILLNEEQFKEKIFDFTSGKKWKYLGDKPCLIDFYADWCAPCKRLSPILEEIAAQYTDKIYIYKVNTDFSQNVAAYFNITGIPNVYLCPLNGEPQSMVGLYPKEEYIKAIDQILGVK